MSTACFAGRPGPSGTEKAGVLIGFSLEGILMGRGGGAWYLPPPKREVPIMRRTTHSSLPCLLAAAVALAATRTLSGADEAPLQGIELSDMDRSVEACSDFYEF